MNQFTPMRARAEAEAARLPPLLAEAEHLAGTVLLGDHGRRRSGTGDDFWQYRPVQPGDTVRMIDWRRSAKSDTQFVREREWQVAQSVMLWVDRAASMRFSSEKNLPLKIDRAKILGLAITILLNRGGERVGLTGGGLPPRRGEVQILRIAEALREDDHQDYAEPEARAMLPHARAVFISDFLGDLGAIKAALLKAADRGIKGLLVQVLDPAEEGFPFHGRTIFQSMGESVTHETLNASDLKTDYLNRLAARKAELQHLCDSTGWQYLCHHTNSPAQSALLWMHRALEGSA